MNLITCEELIEALQNNKELQIIDTRESEYFLGWKNTKGISGHIQGALDFPKSWLKLNDNTLSTELSRRHIKKHIPTIIYGNETLAEDTYNKYLSLCFEHLSVLEGGINYYASNNLPLESMPNYYNYVSPQWLMKVISKRSVEAYHGEKIRIVELLLPGEENDYEKEHIPNATSISTDIINHIPGERDIELYQYIPREEQIKFWQIPDNNIIKSAIESLGIDKNTLTIFYGSIAATTACYRAAYVMEYIGLPNVRILNGGKPLWKALGFPLTDSTISIEKTTLSEIKNNESILVTHEEELSLINNPNAVIASIRSFPEYSGETTGYTYIAKKGDILSSRFAYSGSDPYAMEDYRNPDNTLFNYEICINRWKKWGITPDKQISFHCGTGWRASEAYYLARAMNYPRIGIYAGGWYEWTHFDNYPVRERGIPENSPETIPEEFF